MWKGNKQVKRNNPGLMKGLDAVCLEAVKEAVNKARVWRRRNPAGVEEER